MDAAPSPQRRVATRYVTPLREGGSLPALVEADDDGLYVLKFRGAGQGPKALVAELLAGEIGRRLGLAVPEIVLLDVDPALGRAEPDAEIQDLLRSSAGVNVGLDFLPGSVAYEPSVPGPMTAELAADIVWFDALVTNVDRTARNPNLLVWHDRVWLIDHGAALYRQHSGERLAPLADAPFPQIGDHVLLPLAGPIDAADERLAPALDESTIADIVAGVPDALLVEPLDPRTSDERRCDYVAYLEARLAPPRPFVPEAEAHRAGRD